MWYFVGGGWISPPPSLIGLTKLQVAGDMEEVFTIWRYTGAIYRWTGASLPSPVLVSVQYQYKFKYKYWRWLCLMMVILRTLGRCVLIISILQRDWDNVRYNNGCNPTSRPPGSWSTVTRTWGDIHIRMQQSYKGCLFTIRNIDLSLQ